jgi:ubiquinone/menaquinone biosynthesis C-methylase UbiE
MDTKQNNKMKNCQSSKNIREKERIFQAYARRQSGELYSMFNPGNLFMVQGRERQVLNLLKLHGFANLEEKRILEVGCGAGFWLREFIKWGANPANLTGIDLLPDRIAHAKQVCPESITLICGDAAKLDFPEASFDLVVLSTVFTSILDYGMKQRIAHEVKRVLKTGGLIFWYDFHVNNPRNPDVRGVGRKEICNLFHGCHIKLQRITLAPPISRFLAPYSFLLCNLLEKAPFLCTHYLGIFRKA